MEGCLWRRAACEPVPARPPPPSPCPQFPDHLFPQFFREMNRRLALKSLDKKSRYQNYHPNPRAWRLRKSKFKIIHELAYASAYSS
jgi:hypothetical protein